MNIHHGEVEELIHRGEDTPQQNRGLGKYASIFKSPSTNRKFKKTTTATATKMSPNKDSTSNTMALHIHYNSCYISLRPLQNTEEHKMTKFCVVWRTGTTTDDFGFLFFELQLF